MFHSIGWGIMTLWLRRAPLSPKLAIVVASVHVIVSVGPLKRNVRFNALGYLEETQKTSFL